MKKKDKVRYVLEHLFEGLLSIPKTLYFNFRVLPINKAIKFPIIISYHIKLRGINKRNILIKGKNRFGSIRIGFGGSRFSISSPPRGMISVDNGTIEIGENSGLSQGIILDAKDGKIILGKHFRCNYSSVIAAEKDDIIFGDEVVLGWNVFIRNYDGHTMIYDGIEKRNHELIMIGNHVWIGSETQILKGVKMGSDCVVAYGSLLTNSVFLSNQLIGGRPAKVLKTAVDWKE